MWTRQHPSRHGATGGGTPGRALWGLTYRRQAVFGSGYIQGSCTYTWYVYNSSPSFSLMDPSMFFILHCHINAPRKSAHAKPIFSRTGPKTEMARPLEDGIGAFSSHHVLCVRTCSVLHENIRGILRVPYHHVRRIT